jgi:hypothetical protein
MVLLITVIGVACGLFKGDKIIEPVSPDKTLKVIVEREQEKNLVHRFCLDA